jgi:hypothetical protein
MKILPSRMAPALQSVYEELGHIITSNVNDYDLIYPDVLPFANMLLQKLPENAVLNVNFNLLFKNTLYQTLASQGLATIPSAIASLEQIQNFSGAFIIKPNGGVGAMDRYNFSYRIFNSASDFFDLVPETDEFFTTNIFENYTIQKSLQAQDGTILQLFVAGFVNSKSEIYTEGINRNIMRYDERRAQLRAQGEESENNLATAKYFGNFTRVETYNDPDAADTHGLIAQIQQLIAGTGITSVPFGIQALIDPITNQCYINDFNYKLRPFNFETPGRREYLIDKLNFMYKDTAIQIPETWHTTYPNLDLPNGINQALLTYMAENDITGETWGTTERRSAPFTISAPTKAAMLEKLDNFKTFLASNY